MIRNYINILCDIFINKTHKKEVFFLFFMSILFLYGALLRYQGLLSRELEYDEIWTYSHYVNQSISLIFSNLATPNNHPLYTLFIKMLVPVLKYPVFAIRVPAFLAGLSLMIVIPMITFICARRHYLATLLSLAIVAFNGALIHFSQSGRGYTLQTLCVALFILQITIIIQFRNKYTKLYEYTLFLFPVLAILTLSTSVMYIFPICLIHILYTVSKFWKEKTSFNIKQFLKQNTPLIVSYSILTGFVLFWYIFNYKAFIAGQTFGTKISSLGSFFFFLKTTLFKLASPIFYCLIIASLVNRKNHLKFTLFIFCFFFPFILSIIFLAGPPRVYLPTLILIAIATPTVMTAFPFITTGNKLLGNTSFLAVIFLCVAQYPQEYDRWTPAPWGAISKSLYQRYPDDYFIVYSATNSFAIFLNNPESCTENQNRLPNGENHHLILTEKTLSGMGANKKTISFIIKEKPSISTTDIVTKQPILIYKLRAISEISADKTLDTGRILLVSIFPTDFQNFRKIQKKLSTSMNSRWLICNFFLNTQKIDNHKQSVYGGLIAYRLEKKIRIKELLKMASRLQKHATFYFIDNFKEN